MQGLFVTANGAGGYCWATSPRSSRAGAVMIARKYQQRLIEISANPTGTPGAPGSGPS